VLYGRLGSASQSHELKIKRRSLRQTIERLCNSIALYGAEVWWRGQQDRAGSLQRLINGQARAATGMLSSTPINDLLQAACLSSAVEVLDYRQIRYALQALSAPQDHPTHRLLPASFRIGELYRHSRATAGAPPSSVGWVKTDRPAVKREHRQTRRRDSLGIARLCHKLDSLHTV
jgi:hypothetical protein